jgi:hypothetical protein
LEKNASQFLVISARAAARSGDGELLVDDGEALVGAEPAEKLAVGVTLDFVPLLQPAITSPAATARAVPTVRIQLPFHSCARRGVPRAPDKVVQWSGRLYTGQRRNAR